MVRWRIGQAFSRGSSRNGPKEEAVVEIDWDSYCLVLSKLGLKDNPNYKH
ncbi:unnamed protein product [Camellia sinensis]